MKLLRILTRSVAESTHKILGLLQEASIRRTVLLANPPFGTTCDYLVFFADPVKQIYQVSQWIDPMESLARTGRTVGFVVMDPFVAKQLAHRSNLPILLTRSIESFEVFVAEHNVKAVFYVNNSQANFTALRTTSVTHVHLNHGESDKVSMVSNQLKAYDYAFVAGDAAVERILTIVQRFDPAHLIRIGRPQLDIGTPNYQRSSPSRISVLYAPTWEGDSQQMDYSSLPSIGIAIVKELLSDSRFSVTFRPHPKTGTWSRSAGESCRQIEKLIQKADALDPSSGHRTDRTADATAALVNSDVVVADNSAMTMDAIGLNKPVLLSISDVMRHQAKANPSAQRTIESIQQLGPECIGQIARIVAEVASTPIQREQSALRDCVFGSESLGTGTQRFIEAAERIIAEPMA